MTVKCTFSIPLKSIRDYARQIAELPPLPEYVNKRGPYIDDGPGASNQIITIYEFNESKYPEAWKNIFKQLDAFHGIPGLSFSAQVMAKSNV
jgi:hypothetical protein